jgi:hypothetical protein
MRRRSSERTHWLMADEPLLTLSSLQKHSALRGRYINQKSYLWTSALDTDLRAYICKRQFL